jgi:hypothetical protein
MNFGQQPSTTDKIKSIASDIGENVSQGYNNVSENISQGLSTVKENINQKVNDFSSSSTVTATTSFLEANSMIAKFGFLICVVVVFLILFNLGMQLIGFFLSPSPNPYLISGQIDADHTYTIYQNPQKIIEPSAKDKGNIVTIPRSNNAVTGIEFTWCVWLSFNTQESDLQKYLNVFNKGDRPDGKNFSLNNAPGVYIGPSSTPTSKTPLQSNSLWVLMDTMPLPASNDIDKSHPQKDTIATEYIEITNMPINKYFHLAIRCENKFIDVYINGTVISHTNLINVPKQNFYDVNIGDTGIKNGSIADLRYFSTALSVIEINNIIVRGPNLESALSNSSSQYMPNYLSSMWYQSKIQTN